MRSQPAIIFRGEKMNAEGRFALLILFGLLRLLLSGYAVAGEPNGATQLKVGYGSVTGTRIALWAAREQGFFARQGLQVEIVLIASSSRGIPALLAGEIPIYAGSAETAAQAAVRGAELVIIAGEGATPYKLIVQPGIKNIEQLKGKKFGVDRIGGSSYYVTLRLLGKLGLQPRDVEFMQIPGGGSERVAAFRSGILSAVVTTVSRFELAKIPYRALADAEQMGIHYIGGTYVTTRSFRDRNKGIVLRFVRALAEASHWVKNPKNMDGVLRVFSHNLRTSDPAVLKLNYRIYVPSIPSFPYAQIESLAMNLTDLAESNPDLKKINLDEFVDNSFVQEVRGAGIAQER